MKSYLPKGKKAALCFTIDDIHPSRKADNYDAGGDLDQGVLGMLRELIVQHPQLKITLFTTADWQVKELFSPERVVRLKAEKGESVYYVSRWPRGKMQLDKHPDFVDYLNREPGFEVAYHGLYHCIPGSNPGVEFQYQTVEEFEQLIREMKRIFTVAGLKVVPGICPPGWNAPENFMTAMVKHDLRFLASARDLFTDIHPDAVNRMSGLKDVSLIYPQWIRDRQIVHIPSNFNATRKPERAYDIIRHGGLVSIKGHIMKYRKHSILFDGIDEIYINYLDVLLRLLERDFGEEIWYTSAGEISEKMFRER